MQRVVITGGADGIGLGIARCFLEDGAQVHVCDIRPGAVEEAHKLHPDLKTHVTDVGDYDAVSRFIAECETAMGGIDVLVNNVGVAGAICFVEDIPVDDWDETLRVNTSGMFYGIRQVVGGMKKLGAGSIINISSVGTFTLPTKRSVYNTSKCAVEGLTKSVARELGEFGIRSNAILPGTMNNERMNRIVHQRMTNENRDFDDIMNEYLEFNAMKTVIDVEDIGNMAVFLSSEKARYVTGQLISVCGGVFMEN